MLLRSAINTQHKMAVGTAAILGYGNIGARTDKTQQTNNCLGIHRQTFVTTFNPTCLSRLLHTKELIPFSQFACCRLC